MFVLMQDFGTVEWYYGDPKDPKSDPKRCFDEDTEKYYTDACKAVKLKGGNLLRFFVFFDGRVAPRFGSSRDNLRDTVLGWDKEASLHTLALTIYKFQCQHQSFS